jgi:hypothetical protein
LLDSQSAASHAPRAARASAEPFSVIDVEITGPTPFRLKLRVQPELAPDLASTMASNLAGGAAGNAAGSAGSASFEITNTDGARIGASLRLDRTSFTVAGRPIDVAGQRLQVCGIDFGPIATGDVVTLARGEVRVENAFRAPLPEPVAAH